MVAKVSITVSPAGQNTTRVVDLTRETIKISAVDWKMLNGDIAYLEISTFNQNVDSEFKKAIQEIQKSNA